MSRVVAIHQPTFLPWLGWWDKLARCDVFVLLDDVQFPKKGGTWMNRVKLLVGAEPAWVTVPIDRAYHGRRAVREIRIDDASPWRRKIRQTFATSYGRAPAFTEAVAFLDDVLAVEGGLLAELNEHAIEQAARRLSLDTRKFVRQSELGVDGAGTTLLVDLCRAVDGNAYLTGDGAGEYLEPDLFAAAGLELVQQQFTLPEYPQPTPDPVLGLSFLDAVANVGWDAAAALIGQT